LTTPIDITDSRVIRAIAHPLRLRILYALSDRVASPSEIADELGSPLSNTSYHVRQLATLGFVELVDRAARRGAIEHYYTAKVRPSISAEAWARVPAVLRNAMVSSALQQDVSHLADAAEAGGFTREDLHYSRTNGRLDRQGWEAVAAELSALVGRLEAIFEESEARLLSSDESPDEATVMLVQFAAPPAPSHLDVGRGDPAGDAVPPAEPPVRFQEP
jgi:DNA-binding transcriptional ArsR family regulator